MGLNANIYKHGGASYANGGLSGEHDEVCIVNIDGPSEPNDTHPPVLLVKGAFPGTVNIIPAVEVTGPGAAVEYHGKWGPLRPDGAVGPMNGGCIVSTSDSRFGEAIEALGGERFTGGVALHDRFETPAEYRALSI